MRVEVLLTLILLLAIVLRFMFLDLKLLLHDEGVHAGFSYQLTTTGEYSYNPVYHGTLLYYVISAMFSIFSLCCKENMPIIMITFAVFVIYLLWMKKFTHQRTGGNI